ncbi:NDR1/HIN1-like protein 10 [Lotus japonicus]|uniref:NDR1/HIN1-like protein 10 n=1 Tax=Lotus japonicus TaxID=34305 RepID=UPI00258B3D25|nr:NDR1/HIN1-like protein 10 [Lotus japonicus]
MTDKEPPPPQLNPAAAINIPPPAEQPQPRHHKGRTCCYCLFRTFWILLATILLLACLIILVVWILIQPRSYTFHASQAKLTEFNYNSTTATLRHNLVVNYTVRNPNKKLKIYFDVVVAHALYKDVTFATTDVTMPWRASYLQATKSTVPMSAAFSGQQVVAVDHQDYISDQFEKEKKDGAFVIDTKINIDIRFRLGDFQFEGPSARVKCKLKVPPSSNGDGKTVAVVADAFHPTKCDVDF